MAVDIKEKRDARRESWRKNMITKKSKVKRTEHQKKERNFGQRATAYFFGMFTQTHTRMRAAPSNGV